MSWLTRLLSSPEHLAEESRRVQRTQETLTLANEFMAELRESIHTVKEAGTDERKGYPVEHALKRRRVPHDRSA